MSELERKVRDVLVGARVHKENPPSRAAFKLFADAVEALGDPAEALPAFIESVRASERARCAGEIELLRDAVHAAKELHDAVYTDGIDQYTEVHSAVLGLDSALALLKARRDAARSESLRRRP